MCYTVVMTERRGRYGRPASQTDHRPPSGGQPGASERRRRGYLLPRPPSGTAATFACRHRADQMEAELNAVVDQGCTVLDVIVEHPIYGQLTGPLRLSSRYEVAQFIQRCRQESAAPLSQLTEGVHLHTVLCPDQEAAGRVRAALEALGLLYQ